MIAELARQFNEGGMFMWIILGVLGVAAAVTLERLIFYYVICRQRGKVVLTPLIEALKRGDVQGAGSAVAQGSAPLLVLSRELIARYAQGDSLEEIREGIDERAIVELPRFAERLSYLSLFANVATLLGLLGTIAGLQLSFSSLAAVQATQKATMLAQGISQAMNTTAFGLIVAVPCMVMYTILSNKRQELLKDIDESMVRLLNVVKKSRA
jgi:biopolymer transport protein ExbB/TolQ